MKRLILCAAIALANPVLAQEKAPDPVIIVEDTAPVATGIVVGLLGFLVLVAVVAGAGD